MSTEVFIPYKPHTATLPPFGRTHKKTLAKEKENANGLHPKSERTAI
jgi:hypothetical protein